MIAEIVPLLFLFLHSSIYDVQRESLLITSLYFFQEVNREKNSRNQCVGKMIMCDDEGNCLIELIIIFIRRCLTDFFFFSLSLTHRSKTIIKCRKQLNNLLERTTDKSSTCNTQIYIDFLLRSSICLEKLWHTQTHLFIHRLIVDAKDALRERERRSKKNLSILFYCSDCSNHLDFIVEEEGKTEKWEALRSLEKPFKKILYQSFHFRN